MLKWHLNVTTYLNLLPISFITDALSLTNIKAIKNGLVHLNTAENKILIFDEKLNVN